VSNTTRSARASITVDTAIGHVGVEATDSGVSRVRLPGSAAGASSVGQSPCAAARASAAGDQLVEYARGDREHLEVELDWAGIDPVHRRVLQTLLEIVPFGRTVTYGELGLQAGIEDPRDVGVMMSNNPLPLVVPCHRVVASDGIGGYGGGVDLKRRLLELEGALPPRLDLGVV
jgi:methylated-DNA-[protein]-cysteine S-methyltransferase